MRHTFAHEAVLIMDPDADIRVPGAAVTVALCGGWEHEPPCPLAPHHTDSRRIGGEVHVRILFAAEPDIEGDIRQRIDLALSSGQLRAPDGTASRWQLRSTRPSDVSAEETDHAERLTHG
jgi:hypothetical protein